MSEMKPTSFKSKTAMRRLGWLAWALAVLVVGLAGAAYLSSPAGSQAATMTITKAPTKLAPTSTGWKRNSTGWPIAVIVDWLMR